MGPVVIISTQWLIKENKMKRIISIALPMVFIYMVVPLTLAIGWIININNVLKIEEFSNCSGAEILQVIGAFVPPLGGVLGYLI